MKTKKFMAVLLCVALLCSMFAFSSSAEERVDVNVYIVETYISGENYMYKAMYPIVDRMFDVVVDFDTPETFSSCNFSLSFNDEVLRCESDSVAYGSSDINYMPMSESVSTGNKIDVHIFDDKGIAKPDLFSYRFRFSVIDKGELDINVEMTQLIDGNGKSYDADVNIYLPVYSYKSDEIPDVLPDFETSLSYGFSLYIKTELAYPMTAEEFTGKMKNAENCEFIVKTADGELLEKDAVIPTGAMLTVIYDNMVVFETTFVYIGDANCDGKVNSADARLVLRFSAKLDYSYRSNRVVEIASNVASDTNEINSADARELLRYSAKIGQTYTEWYEYHCILEKYNRDLLNDNL